MTTIRYCEKCFQMIESYGYIAREVYVQICSDYVLDDSSFYYDDELNTDVPLAVVEVIKLLELKGFILTTDIIYDKRHQIVIKPLGHFMDDENINYFCREDHENIA